VTKLADEVLETPVADQPAFRADATVYAVGGNQVIVVVEDRQYALEGRAFVALADRLETGLDRGNLILEAAEDAPLHEVVYALSRMEAAGHVVGGTTADEPNAPASGRVEVVGDLDLSVVAETLRKHRSSVPVVLTDDYLRPELAEIDAAMREAGTSWLLAKPVGTSLWIGPLVVPGETACWTCMSDRLRGNRQVETYVERKTGVFPATTRAQSPSVEAVGTGFVTAALDGCADVDGLQAYTNLLHVHDLVDWGHEVHDVVRRPQCSGCGDPALRDPARLPDPIQLEPRAKVFTRDGGHRSARPEETLRRLGHHVSSLTGVVSNIDTLTDPEDDLLHAYNAGHNFAMITDDLFFLRRNLRGRSGGKGMTDTQARVSALCEAIERWSGVWRGDEPARRASVAEMGDEALDLRSLLCFSDQQYAGRDAWNAAQPDTRQHIVPEPLPDDLQIEWTSAWSLTKERRAWVPSAYAWYGHDDLRKLFFCTSDANGCASGNSLEEAILQGALEVVERDATALWWYNRARVPGVDLASLGIPYVDRLLEFYAEMGRELWVLDLTGDLGIPVFAGISRRVDREPEDILLGLGAHLDPMTALLRALTEVNQFLPAVAHTHPDGSTEYWFPDTEAHDWWRTATIESEPWLLPREDAPLRRREDMEDLSTDDIARDVGVVVDRLASAGLETWVVDQTRPDVDLAVAKVIVPGMRHFWRRLGVGRLYDTPPELGWTDRANTEDEMNPWSIFF
jgi:oxazoline/thiazoline synthase